MMKYKVIEELGCGGYGCVYLATNADGKYFAIKFLKDGKKADTEIIERFIHECEVTSDIAHPNIVSCHGIEEDENGDVYLITDHIDGADLEDIINNSHLTYKEVLKYIRDIASAIYYLDSKNIIHRDIKPANVIVDGNGTAKLIDFGMSKSDKLLLDEENLIIGTPYYTSPEHIMGDPISSKHDIYALGVLFYYLIEGHLPFEGGITARVLRGHLYDDPEIKNAPPKIKQIIMSMLEKDPRDRIGARALINQLSDAILSGDTSLNKEVGK